MNEDYFRELANDVSTLVEAMNWMKDSQQDQTRRLNDIETSVTDFKGNCRNRHEALERDRTKKWGELNTRVAAYRAHCEAQRSAWDSVWTKAGVIGTVGVLLVYLGWSIWGTP